MRSLSGLVMALSIALLAGCQSAPSPSVAHSSAAASVPAAAVATERWVRTELYCRIAPLDAEGLGLASAEGMWRTFLDEEVTPRFPDGFSVFDASGQGREETADTISRERNKVLVLIYPDTAARRAGIEALCTAFKTRSGEKGLLVVTAPVDAQMR